VIDWGRPATRIVHTWAFDRIYQRIANTRAKNVAWQLKQFGWERLEDVFFGGGDTSSNVRRTWRVRVPNWT